MVHSGSKRLKTSGLLADPSIAFACHDRSSLRSEIAAGEHPADTIEMTSDSG